MTENKNIVEILRKCVVDFEMAESPEEIDSAEKTIRETAEKYSDTTQIDFNKLFELCNKFERHRITCDDFTKGIRLFCQVISG